MLNSAYKLYIVDAVNVLDLMKAVNFIFYILNLIQKVINSLPTTLMQIFLFSHPCGPRLQVMTYLIPHLLQEQMYLLVHFGSN